MKKIFLMCCFCLSILQLSAQKFDTPVAYNDFIVELQTQIGAEILAFNDKIGAEGANESNVSPYVENILKATRQAIQAVEKMPAYEGNSDLRNASLELFRFYERVVNNEYKQMVKLIFAEGGLSDENAGKLAELLQQVVEGENPYDESFQKSQREFAERYNFRLNPNELQGELDNH